MADALNPNHRVTRAVEDQWHKLLAIVLHKYGDVLPREVVITRADLEAFLRSGCTNIVCHDKADGFYLRIVDDAEGQRLARGAGGLPS